MSLRRPGACVLCSPLHLSEIAPLLHAVSPLLLGFMLYDVYDVTIQRSSSVTETAQLMRESFSGSQLQRFQSTVILSWYCRPVATQSVMMGARGMELSCVLTSEKENEEGLGSQDPSRVHTLVQHPSSRLLLLRPHCISMVPQTRD